MNIIKTVGDLTKALSAYDENLPLEFSCSQSYGVTLPLILNNDTQIFCSLASQILPESKVFIILGQGNPSPNQIKNMCFRDLLKTSHELSDEATALPACPSDMMDWYLKVLSFFDAINYSKKYFTN